MLRLVLSQSRKETELGRRNNKEKHTEVLDEKEGVGREGEREGGGKRE